MTARISRLNALTSSDPSVFTHIKMPQTVRKKLLALDFDDWDDVTMTTQCSAEVLRELQRAVESVADLGPPALSLNLARKRAALDAEEDSDSDAETSPHDDAAALRFKFAVLMSSPTIDDAVRYRLTC
jgi:hypothetical protein